MGGIDDGFTFDEEVKCTKETSDAILVRWGLIDEMWVPKSQVHEDSEVWKHGQEGTLVVSTWWAEQRGL